MENLISVNIYVYLPHTKDRMEENEMQRLADIVADKVVASLKRSPKSKTSADNRDAFMADLKADPLLNRSAAALKYGVTRQTIYNWMKGHE